MNMRHIATGVHLFIAASIAGIQTQILRVFFIRFWTQHHDMIQGFPTVWYWLRKEQLPKEGRFHPSVHCVLSLFFLDPLASFQRLPGPAVLLLCSRLDFAISQPIPSSSSYFSRPLDHIFSKYPAAGYSVFFGHCFPLVARS